MPDSDRPAAPPSRAAVDAALAAVDWRKVQRQVLAYAFSRTKSKADAQDLTQEAIRRVYDSEHNPWNPERHPDVTIFLIGIVSRNLSNDRTSARRHHEITVQSGPHEIRVTRAADRVPAPAQTPEAAVATHDLFDRRLAALRARAAADPLVLQLVDAMAQDIETPAEQVEALGLPLEDIRRARRRLFDHADIVARELPADGSVSEDDEDAE